MEHFTASVREGILATAVLSKEMQVGQVARLHAWRCTDVTNIRQATLTTVDVVQGVVRLLSVPQIAAPAPDASFRAPVRISHNDEPFAFSPGTLRLVRAGFEAVSSELRRALWGVPGGAETAIFPGASDDAWLRGFVSDRLVGMLATVADVLRAYDVRQHVLVGSRGFSDEVEPMVQGRIPCVTRSFPELSASLGLDIRASLIRRGTLSFGWGSLVMETGAVSMFVDPPAPAKRRLGQPVRRVE